MKHLNFSEILQVILAVNKRNKKTIGWVKQEAIVNSIFQFLEIPARKMRNFMLALRIALSISTEGKISLRNSRTIWHNKIFLKS